MVALRMGERGSLLAEQGSGRAYFIPPLPVERIVDQTGAGNAYCGGFVVGWCLQRDLAAAGCYAAAAATFTLETVGAADIPPARELAWHRRFEAAQRGVKQLEL